MKYKPSQTEIVNDINSARDLIAAAEAVAQSKVQTQRQEIAKCLRKARKRIINYRDAKLSRKSLEHKSRFTINLLTYYRRCLKSSEEIALDIACKVSEKFISDNSCKRRRKLSLEIRHQIEQLITKSPCSVIVNQCDLNEVQILLENLQIDKIEANESIRQGDAQIIVPGGIIKINWREQLKSLIESLKQR